jgi:hypothetical protein
MGAKKAIARPRMQVSKAVVRIGFLSESMAFKRTGAPMKPAARAAGSSADR